MIVVGIDKFREHFAGHEDMGVIIGGGACDHWFNDAGLRFKATKDIDMVLRTETIDTAFDDSVQRFLDAGGYGARERSDGKKNSTDSIAHFYRVAATLPRHIGNLRGSGPHARIGSENRPQGHFGLSSN